MKTPVKVFIDGGEGTTGLKIHKRFELRDDVEVLQIPTEFRKDVEKRRQLINESDVTFLCLPDQAAIEAASLVENENVTLIDTSTAHRINPGWAYGFPELSKEHREKIANGKRIAVPGCHASGFIALAYPLVNKKLISPKLPLSCFSLTGYSGGGKKMIAQYEDEGRDAGLSSPRPYGLTQQHKHLKEMKYVTGLETAPIFVPVVDDYYCGMLVTLPLHASMMTKGMGAKELSEFYADYYKGSKFVRVLPFENEDTDGGLLASNKLADLDYMEIIVTGNDERITVYSRFDNLGKGASGAAIECMNINCGFAEETGLMI